MRSAPSVQYPAGRCAFQARLELGLFTGWMVLQLAWAWSLDRGPLPGAWWLASLLGLIWLLVSRWRSRHPIEGELAWEAPVDDAGLREGRWVWASQAYRSGTELASVECTLDLQGVMLLRVRQAAGLTWWIWLERRSAPDAWGDLRRALVAHQQSAAG